MDHAQQLPRAFPWRTATLVMGAIATLELVALIVGGALLFTRPLHHLAAKGAAPEHAQRATAAARPAVHVRRATRVPSLPLRPRSRVAVLVLNGNGFEGAARAEAARLRGIGYRIGGAKNAARRNYARSMVMYAPGYGKEARRLARDAGVRLVAPVDGMSPAALKASPLVLLLGS
ncbi:MAG: LytR C-terminal domain-containing protein [Gaiellaceae bacterium]